MPTRTCTTIAARLLCAAAVAAYGGIRLVGEINLCLNLKPVKYLLERRLRESLDATASVGRAVLHVGGGAGVAFHDVSVRSRGGFEFEADRVAMVLSPLRGVAGGGWIRRVCFIRPRVRVEAGASEAVVTGDLPELEVIDPEILVIMKSGTLAVSGGLTARVRVLRRDGLSIAGEARFDDTEVRFGNEILTINGMVWSSGRELASHGIEIRAGELAVAASGTFSFGPRRTFHGKVDIEGLRIGGGGGGGPILAAILDGLSGGADFGITNMTLFGVPVERVTAGAEARNGTIYLNGLRASGRFLSGTGSVTLDPRRATGFDVTFALKDYPIPAILASVTSSSRWIDASMDLEGRVWGTPASINGDLVFSSFNGRIMRYEFVTKLLGALNLYRLVTMHHPDLRQRGFPYLSMVSGFTIRDSLVSFDRFYLESERMRLSAYGTFSMKSNTLDAHLGIHPLETVDRVLSMIPIVGWLLSGKDGGFFVMYLRVTGPPDGLRVVPAPLAGLTRSISGAIMRTITLPYTIVTKPQRLVPGGGDGGKR